MFEELFFYSTRDIDQYFMPTSLSIKAQRLFGRFLASLPSPCVSTLEVLKRINLFVSISTTYCIGIAKVCCQVQFVDFVLFNALVAVSFLA